MKKLFYIQILVSIVFIMIIIFNHIRSQGMRYTGPDSVPNPCPPGYKLTGYNCLPIQPQNTLDDNLSNEQLDILDNAPIDSTTNFEDMVLPDGRNISDWKKENDPDWKPVFN